MVKSTILAIVLTCLSALTAMGQVTTDSLSGIVSDQNNAVVAGATVTVSRKGKTRNITVNALGKIQLQ